MKNKKSTHSHPNCESCKNYNEGYCEWWNDTMLSRTYCSEFKEKQSWQEEYDNIFGEKHHTICEGKKCECHKEVKQFITNLLDQEYLRRRKEKSLTARVNYESAKWEERKKIIEEIEKWNSSGYMSDCLGEFYWKQLINIIKTT